MWGPSCKTFAVMASNGGLNREREMPEFAFALPSLSLSNKKEDESKNNWNSVLDRYRRLSFINCRTTIRGVGNQLYKCELIIWQNGCRLSVRMKHSSETRKEITKNIEGRLIFTKTCTWLRHTPYGLDWSKNQREMEPLPSTRWSFVTYSSPKLLSPIPESGKQPCKRLSVYVTAACL